MSRLTALCAGDRSLLPSWGGGGFIAGTKGGLDLIQERRDRRLEFRVMELGEGGLEGLEGGPSHKAASFFLVFQFHESLGNLGL